MLTALILSCQSFGSIGNESDGDFDPSADMLVNDFDDEHTLDEEEEIVDGSEEAENEIDKLQEVKSRLSRHRQVSFFFLAKQSIFLPHVDISFPSTLTNSLYNQYSLPLVSTSILTGGRDAFRRAVSDVWL